VFERRPVESIARTLSTYVPGVRVVLALAASLTVWLPAAMRIGRPARGLATVDWLTPTAPTVIHSAAVTKRSGLVPRTVGHFVRRRLFVLFRRTATTCAGSLSRNRSFSAAVAVGDFATATFVTQRWFSETSLSTSGGRGWLGGGSGGGGGGGGGLGAAATVTDLAIELEGPKFESPP
jgi:uncharacterized membrane protein YgcG